LGREESDYAVRSGDKESFREVYLEYFPRLKSYFGSRGFSSEDAEGVPGLATPGRKPR